MSTVPQFLRLLQAHGSSVLYHREIGGTDCPCLTPEGFRDPEWHLAHPLEPVCNAQGKLTTPVSISIKGFCQPAQSTRATRMSDETLQQLFGEVRESDHIGILPLSWNGAALDFSDWSQDGNDWLEYNGDRYLLVTVHILPDPSDGLPHHCECGMRKISVG